MVIIKLNATESTNDYLKELNRQQSLENFTIVSTFQQTNGKGQMGSKWISEFGKNLTFSVLYKYKIAPTATIFDANVAVSTAIIQVLKALNIPKLNIKWPNDILAENKKIGGILIENSLKINNTIESIIGIGLNVNQEEFPEFTTASSLKNSTSLEYDLDLLLEKLGRLIKNNLENLSAAKDNYWQSYRDCLFKRSQPMVFENKEQQRFMGIIQDVNSDGKLVIKLEDDTLMSFGIKEIKMLY